MNAGAAACTAYSLSQFPILLTFCKVLVSTCLEVPQDALQEGWDLESYTSIQDPNDWLRNDDWTETSLSLTRHIRLLKPLRMDHPSSRACIYCNSFVTSCHTHWQVSNASINRLRRKDGALADNLHGLGGPCSGLFPRLPPDRP